MPRLLAIIPEDGWALVADGEAVILIRPPFGISERSQVSKEILADSLTLHGYEAKANMPEEAWARVIQRICEIMCSVRQKGAMPPDCEILARVLRSGPSSVLASLLDRLEEDLFLDLAAAENALRALLAEERVKNNHELLDRALRVRRKLDALSNPTKAP